MCHMHFNRTPKWCYSGLGSSAAPADLSAAAAVSYASPMNSTLLIFDKRQCIPSMYAGSLAFHPLLWKREEKNVWNFVKIQKCPPFILFHRPSKKKNWPRYCFVFLKWITFSILTFDDHRLRTSCNRPRVCVHDDGATGLEDDVKMKISRKCVLLLLLPCWMSFFFFFLSARDSW